MKKITVTIALTLCFLLVLSIASYAVDSASNAKILQVNFKLNISGNEYEKAAAGAAPVIANVAGLRWKVWIMNEAEHEAGGIYLFDDQASLEAFLAGPIVAKVKSNPAYSDISMKQFDVLDKPTQITRGPIDLKQIPAGDEAVAGNIKILQVNFKNSISRDVYEQAAVGGAAQPIADVPGLRWKVWIMNESEKELGGIYLFNDQSSLEAYLAGPIIAKAKSNPANSDISMKQFDVLDKLSQVTRGPIGLKQISAGGEEITSVAIDTTKPWRLSGNYFESCNCDIPCPCNVGGMPTEGFCRLMANWHIVYGFYGDVSLNGINVSLLLDFPGAPKDGNATIATYISDNAKPEQVEAIKNIVKMVIGPRTKTDLGTKLVPIAFAMSGDTYTWAIPNILEMKSTLVRDMPDVPGIFAPIYHQAKSDVYKYKDYGRDWDYSGKNSGQGRLLLPPEKPSNKVLGTIRVGVFPNGMAVNPYTRTAMTANTGDGTVSLIDLTTRKVTKTIHVGKNTVGPVINPNTNIAVVAGFQGDDTVSIIDLASGNVTKSITVGKVPLCIGIDTVHNIIVVANMGSNNVSVIDLTTEKVIKTIPVGVMPTCMHWDINPYTNQTIVTNTGENTLSVIDLVKGVEIQKIPVGKSPIGASLNPYTNIAVVSNTGDNTVSVVDLTAGKVITTITVGGMPSCSVIESTMNIALIANTADDTVSIISLNTMSVIDTIPVGVSLPGLSGCLAIDEATMTALIGNSGSNDLTIVDLKKIAPVTVDFSNTFFMSLDAGLNMISLPLKPNKEMTARDLMKETGSTVVIKYDTNTSHFSGFSQSGSGNGFSLEGGKGYILNVPAGKVVPFVGAAWTNEPPLAPPSGLKSSGWAFVVSGNMSDYKTGDYTVIAKNLRTGNISTDSIADGRFNVVFADLNRNSVVEAGDKVEIVVKDSTGNIVAGPTTKQIGTGDIQMAFSDITIKFGYLRPQNSILLQNYPNPFNPETWIPFNLAKEADVNVRIYDTGGKLVRSLSLGRKDPGVYTDKDKAIHWDGKSEFGEVVSSGIYFYTIQAGEFSATRKMIVKK